MNTNQKKVSRFRGTSRITTGVSRRTNNREVAMNAKNIIRMASAIVMAVALTVLAPSPVLAQDTDTAAPAAAPEPTNEKSLKWCVVNKECKSEETDRFSIYEDYSTCPVDCAPPADIKVDVLDPEVVKVLFTFAYDYMISSNFSQKEKWMTEIAPEGFKGLYDETLPAGTVKKGEKAATLGGVPRSGIIDTLDAKTKGFITPAGKAFGYMRDSDGNIEDLRTAWKAHLASFGCEKESDQGCKDLLKKSADIAWTLINMTPPAKQYKAKNLLLGYLGTVPRIEEKILGTQAVLRALPENISQPVLIAAKTNGVGTRVPYSELVNHVDDYLSVYCLDADMIQGYIPTLTGPDQVVVANQAITAEDEGRCVFYVVAQQTPCQKAKATMLLPKDKKKIEGRDIADKNICNDGNWIGREVAIYRTEEVEGQDPKCTVTYGITAEPAEADAKNADFIVADQKVLCKDVTDEKVIVALGPEAGEGGGGNTTIGMFGIGLFGGWAAGLGSNANDTNFTMFGGEFDFRPFSKLGFSLDLHLKIGAIYAAGVAPYASNVPNTSDKFSFLGGVGLGGSYIWKLLEISIKGDFLFTGEGGIGGGGELRIGMAWEHFAWYVGVMAGYLKTGIPAGDNPDVLPERKIDGINSGYIGPEGGIEFRF